MCAPGVLYLTRGAVFTDIKLICMVLVLGAAQILDIYPLYSPPLAKRCDKVKGRLAVIPTVHPYNIGIRRTPFYIFYQHISAFAEGSAPQGPVPSFGQVR